jgi:hypothetical protein
LEIFIAKKPFGTILLRLENGKNDLAHTQTLAHSLANSVRSTPMLHMHMTLQLNQG